MCPKGGRQMWGHRWFPAHRVTGTAVTRIFQSAGHWLTSTLCVALFQAFGGV